jgi:hypothetical protein
MGSVRDIASDPDRTYRRAHLAHSAYPTSSYSRAVFLSAIGNRRVFGGRWTDREPIEEGILCGSA